MLFELNFKYGKDGQPDLEPEARKINAGTLLYLPCQVLLVSKLDDVEFEKEFGDFSYRVLDWYASVTESPT